MPVIRPLRALVRRPSPDLAAGEVTHIARAPVDAARALQQHTAYCALLAAHGYELLYLPELPEHPDGVFVEDVLVVLDALWIATRPGAHSRRGEVASAVARVEALGCTPVQIRAPGTLDGGDVLVLARHVLVGCGARTNTSGCAQLEALTRDTGRSLVPMTVRGALHLKTAVTALPDGALIALPQHVDTHALGALGYEVVLAREASGSDVLCLGQTVVLPSDAPGTAALLRARGLAVECIDVSEFQKVEAGVTCLSVLF